MLRGTQVCGYSLGLKIAYCAVPDPILEGSGEDLTCVTRCFARFWSVGAVTLCTWFPAVLWWCSETNMTKKR